MHDTMPVRAFAARLEECPGCVGATAKWGGMTVVVLKNDLDTFCKYVAMRPPNVDQRVEQHIEDRPLEAAIRGVYYVARYRHRPDAGEAITVTLDQYCGRADPDASTNEEADATARRIGWAGYAGGGDTTGGAGIRLIRGVTRTGIFPAGIVTPSSPSFPVFVLDASGGVIALERTVSIASPTTCMDAKR